MVQEIQYERLTGTLSGQRVYLRVPKRDEVSFVQALWADPETMEAVGGTHTLPTEKFDRWFAYMVDPGNPEACYCLIFNKDDLSVGEISFHQWNPVEQSAVLNIKILAEYRGRGYAADALKAFLSWFFTRAGGRKIIDDVALDNQSGQRLLKSVGFEPVNNRDPAHDCKAEDVCMLDMTKEMFAAKYG
jgi:RimJ/RimL family protein N-acetyltransferase